MDATNRNLKLFPNHTEKIPVTSSHRDYGVGICSHHPLLGDHCLYFLPSVRDTENLLSHLDSH